jgi:hypothetical protein
MHNVDEIINEAKDAREVKRAVSVKMSTQGFSHVQIGHVLNVSPQYVSKGKGLYETGGDAAIPVKVGIFHDCSGFAVMEACRGPHHRRGESQERAC